MIFISFFTTNSLALSHGNNKEKILCHYFPLFGAVLVVLLLAYLIYALLNAEDF
ncbi:K(+)-transporting ATPase subunit F [Providencia hangzhouensis]|uniref:K(+)-transporting ATPase subunit F n=1 Tax=Providencia hangzhouensis TaxID=3031799 RepID=UPI0034DD3A67